MALTSWACMETCRSLSALPAKPLPMPQCSNPCSWPAGPRGDSIPRHSPPDWFLRQHWWLIQGMDTGRIHKSTTHPCLLRPFLIPTNLRIGLPNRYIVTAKSQTASTKVSEPKFIKAFEDQSVPVDLATRFSSYCKRTWLLHPSITTSICD
jgi:hypothetical protein